MKSVLHHIRLWILWILAAHVSVLYCLRTCFFINIIFPIGKKIAGSKKAKNPPVVMCLYQGLSSSVDVSGAPGGLSWMESCSVAAGLHTHSLPNTHELHLAG